MSYDERMSRFHPYSGYVARLFCRAGWGIFLKPSSSGFRPIEIAAVIKIITATVSWVTVLALIPTVPRAMRLLRLANDELIDEISQRRAIEQKLRLCQNALDTVPQAVLWIESSGRIVYANEFACTQYQYTQQELERLSIADISLDFDSSEDFATFFAQVSVPEQRRMQKSLHRKKDGTTFPAAISAHMVPGGIEEICCVFAGDVTEEAQSEEKRRRFFNSAIDFFGVVDLKSGQLSHVSPSWVDILGFQPATVVEQSLYYFVHESDRPTVRRALVGVAEGSAFGVTIRMVHQNGGTRWIEWRGQPVAGESEVYISGRDVTDGEQEVIRRVARAISPQLYVYDIDEDRIIFQNHDVARSLGHNEEQGSESGAVTRLAHPKDLPRLRSHCDALRKADDDTVYDLEYRMRHVDGSWHWFLRRDAVFQRSRDGQVQQIVGTATHVNELQLLKAHMIDLERANSDLAAFAYVASHDLKQPLRGIDNLAIWIAEDSKGALPEKSQEHLKKLRLRVSRMEGLLSELLNYSRVGRTPETIEPVDLKLLIRGLCDLLDPPPQFKVECLGEMPPMRVARVPLEQVLRNVIGNAIKHRDSDVGFVQIRATQTNDRVYFRIHDDGPGIAEEFHERVFGMFVTLRPRDEIEASGMGLAISRKTIESKNGSIKIESRPGEGTTILFDWPAEEEVDLHD